MWDNILLIGAEDGRIFCYDVQRNDTENIVTFASNSPRKILSIDGIIDN
jgi:hypothetical protein